MDSGTPAGRNLPPQRLFWRALFVTGLLWTTWASLVPVSTLPQVTIWDKLAHAVNYAILAALLLSAQARPRVLVAGGWVMLFGVAIEFAQAMTGYRSGDWHDALANLLGIGATATAWYLLSRRRAGA